MSQRTCDGKKAIEHYQAIYLHGSGDFFAVVLKPAIAALLENGILILIFIDYSSLPPHNSDWSSGTGFEIAALDSILRDGQANIVEWMNNRAQWGTKQSSKDFLRSISSCEHSSKTCFEVFAWANVFGSEQHSKRTWGTLKHLKRFEMSSSFPSCFCAAYIGDEGAGEAFENVCFKGFKDFAMLKSESKSCRKYSVGNTHRTVSSKKGKDWDGAVR